MWLILSFWRAKYLGCEIIFHRHVNHSSPMLSFLPHAYLVKEINILRGLSWFISFNCGHETSLWSCSFCIFNVVIVAIIILFASCTRELHFLLLQACADGYHLTAFRTSKMLFLYCLTCCIMRIKRFFSFSPYAWVCNSL